MRHESKTGVATVTQCGSEALLELHNLAQDKNEVGCCTLAHVRQLAMCAWLRPEDMHGEMQSPIKIVCNSTATDVTRRANNTNNARAGNRSNSSSRSDTAVADTLRCCV